MRAFALFKKSGEKSHETTNPPEEIRAEGKGLHTGRLVALELLPAAEGMGFVLNGRI